MAEHAHEISTLNTLIATTIDSVTGYEDSAQNIDNERFREIFRDEGVDLVVAQRVFEQIAELALEYKTGARSLRGIFEELITPILYEVTDRPDIGRVEISSLFNEPVYIAKAEAASTAAFEASALAVSPGPAGILPPKF